MPYIKQEYRISIEEELNTLIEAMKFDGINGVGDCNYVITKLLQGVLQPKTYTDMNAVIGVLECAKMEFYRRAAAPYEDQKAGENGDVY